MADWVPEIERLTSEELLSIVLATIAPAEVDPLHERGLRFDAQRAATELYCRASSSRPESQCDPALPEGSVAKPRLRSL